MDHSFVLKGNICYSEDKDTLHIVEHGYLVCENGISKGVFEELPERYETLPVKDCGDKLIIPGLVDLHVHAPQYTFRGCGMDLELLDWLNTHTFPEEAKYADVSYAEEAYRIFVEELRNSQTTRAAVFGTLHVEGTKVLMDLLEKSGLKTFVGKVNMDRNGNPELEEESAEHSAKETVRWLDETKEMYQNTKPILTPRFIPSCSDELMRRLKEIQAEQGLPVQSHLCENQSEIAWVRELCPQAASYSDAYARYGLFGGDCRTIMAHCVWMSEEEIQLMKERQVYVAHCPQSNMNLSSGIAPIRRFLEEGIPTGLGSDVAGGSQLSIFRAMAEAIQCSKMRWRLTDETLAPLTMEEAFFMGTKGGGAFFGNVGSFEEGYEFDALVLDDSMLRSPKVFSVKERLERLIYLSDDRQIEQKYVAGAQLF